MLFCRCIDVPVELQSLLEFTKAMLFIPGPKKPKCMDSYRWPVDREWQRLALEGEEAWGLLQAPMTMHGQLHPEPEYQLRLANVWKKGFTAQT